LFLILFEERVCSGGGYCCETAFVNAFNEKFLGAGGKSDAGFGGRNVKSDNDIKSFRPFAILLK